MSHRHMDIIPSGSNHCDHNNLDLPDRTVLQVELVQSSAPKDTISEKDGLPNKSSKEDILTALEVYCSHIAAQNRQALELYIPLIANAEPPEDAEIPKDEVLPERLVSLSQLLDAPIDVILRSIENLGQNPGIVSEPTEVLTRYEELVPLLGLDGVDRIRKNRPGEEDESDKEHRALMVNEYFTGIETALKEHSLEEVRDTITIPEELRILSELGVDCLHGPGLGLFRSRHQVTFWLGPGEYGAPASYSARVQDPDTMSYHSGLDNKNEWVVAGGWDMGCAPDYAFCAAVFCRRVDEEDFAWRYTLSLEGDWRVFDTIPELLAWYKEFNVESLDWIRDLVACADGETVFRPEW